MRETKNKKRVIVAMSGGVDSSVAAALFKKGLACPELGRRDVVGVFMKFWSPLRGSTQIYTDKKTDLRRFENRCCSSEAEKRARLVAEKLNIPFYVFNFEKEFKKKVVDCFLKEERAGLTPNPCVVCNKEIKFGLLFKKMLSLNADYIATGHYVRLRRPGAGYKLLKARDKNKDQSYFLWKLNQKQLSRILFPVGDYTKDEVRKLAKKFKLPVLKIPESQEICFIQTTINDFLKKYLKLKPGKIVDLKGRILGEHLGLWFYTIGQRKGLKIGRDRVSTGSAGKPFYVLDKDIKRNLLIVSQNEKDLYKKEFIARNINWISPYQSKHGTGQAGKEAKLPLKVKAQIRYRHKAVLATLKKDKNRRIKVVFSRVQRAITPGQSVVFYKGNKVIGGGIIQ